MRGMDIQELRRQALKRIIGDMSYKAFAELHNVDASYISQILGKHRSFGEKAASNMEARIGLRAGTLLSPEGEDIVTPVIADEQSHGDYAFIPVLSIKAAAGSGHENVDEVSEGTLAFKREWMVRQGLREENLRLIRACGDSMYPSIIEGDMLLVDTSRIEPHSGNVYAIRRPDYSLSVKRLVQGFTGDWAIVSDNPDKSKHRDEPVGDISTSNIPIVGRVVWRGGMM
ncbi:S24 family peptidase [Carnimonas bestiolae]|uniref:S24 family peptidase n=1 Tax=Carnimonas bestiolae TaxID=3402172 RepID=UPI003EDCA468